MDEENNLPKPKSVSRSANDQWNDDVKSNSSSTISADSPQFDEPEPNDTEDQNHNPQIPQWMFSPQSYDQNSYSMINNRISFPLSLDSSRNLMNSFNSASTQAQNQNQDPNQNQNQPGVLNALNMNGLQDNFGIQPANIDPNIFQSLTLSSIFSPAEAGVDLTRIIAANQSPISSQNRNLNYQRCGIEPANFDLNTPSASSNNTERSAMEKRRKRGTKNGKSPTSTFESVNTSPSCGRDSNNLRGQNNHQTVNRNFVSIDDGNPVADADVIGDSGSGSSPISGSSSGAGSGQGTKRKASSGSSAEKPSSSTDRQRRNNESARKSRNARKAQENAMFRNVEDLEEENLRLRSQIAFIQSEIFRLRMQLLERFRTKNFVSPRS